MSIIDHPVTMISCAQREDKQERYDMTNSTSLWQTMKLFGLAFVFACFLSAAFSSPVAAQDGPQPGDPDWCDEELQEGLTKTAEQHLLHVLQTGQTAIKENMRAYAANPMSVHDTVGRTACIDEILEMFKMLADRIGKTTPMGMLWENIYERLLNEACEAAKDAIMTSVDNALNKLCIPYPEFGYYSLDLPVPQRTSCAGHNLLELMEYTAVLGEGYGSRVPEDYLSNALGRMIDVRGNSIGISTATW